MWWLYLDGAVSAGTGVYAFRRYRTVCPWPVVLAHAAVFGLVWPAFWTVLGFERLNGAGACPRP